jgi:hypothetical protein
MKSKNMYRSIRRLSFVVSNLVAGLMLCQASASHAQTKTVTFDWEDGVSTTYGYFAGHGASAVLSNVTTGGDLDYTLTPATPTPYSVSPFGGHMLEMFESPLSDAPGSMYGVLAAVENLDAGDTVNFSFHAYIPSDPVPAGAMYVAPNAHLAISGVLPNPPGSGDAFAGGLGQQPKPVGITPGWVKLEYDSIAGGIIDPIVFDPNGGFITADSLYLRARGVNPFDLVGFPTTTDLDQNFYIDNFSVTVTSNNPAAVIILPDGSSTFVVPEPASSLLLLLMAIPAIATTRKRFPNQGPSRSVG